MVTVASCWWQDQHDGVAFVMLVTFSMCEIGQKHLKNCVTNKNRDQSRYSRFDFNR